MRLIPSPSFVTNEHRRSLYREESNPLDRDKVSHHYLFSLSWIYPHAIACETRLMQHQSLLYALVLALLIAALTVVARRVHVLSPILLLIAGALIAFTPGMPQLVLDPELVLLTLLPPLLYSSGVGMSWRGFRSNLRPIVLLAIGCVLFTATAVAALVHYLLGVPWTIGFVLGAIVAPPDAVAPMA